MIKSIRGFRKAADGRCPLTMVTCYDAWTARLIAGSPIDAILVGDSVAMVMHGFDSTLHADVPMMALHTAAVRRGAPQSFIVADMPFPSHRLGSGPALEAVDALVKAGAHAVKIEGAAGHLETVSHIVGSGIPVMGHLGLTPQAVHQLGGYRVQGREPEAATRLREEARSLAEAGVFGLVLECVPAALAAVITAELPVPTIGIGSGPDCDGQILVLQDLLGAQTDFQPRFVRTYMDSKVAIKDALERYAADVSARRFPSAEESF